MAIEHPVPEFVPAEETIFADIAEVVAKGIRRPGSPADEWCEQWAAERFRALGLEDVRLEPVELPVWDFRAAALDVWPADASPAEAIRLPAFALPYTLPTGEGGFEADLALYVNGEEGTDADGKIAVEHVQLTRLPQSIAKTLANAVYDPEDEFDDLVQVLPFGRVTEIVEPVMAAGAAGYVGVLSGFPWDTHDYYVPYDAVHRPLPAVWISRSAGAILSELMSAADVRGRITVDAEQSAGRSHNVIGTLPGASDEYVVIASHHDAPWASAVEDGSGIALVLAQAAYWAQIPAEERPHNLIFLLTAGHMAHAAGTAGFIATHRELLDRTVLEVHLEHAANECRPDGDTLVPTGEPEVRWWFTTEEPLLTRAVSEALATEDLRRSLVFKPDVFFETPPTDGAFFHAAGVPLVNYLTAPMYLFDSCDTIDKVHRPSLVPVTRATIRIVASLAGRTAADLRGGVTSAAS